MITEGRISEGYDYEDTVIVGRFENSTVRALNSDCGLHFGAYQYSRWGSDTSERVETPGDYTDILHIETH
jgi:uncharacterized membrane protein